MGPSWGCVVFSAASLGYEVIFLPTTLCHAFHEIHLQASLQRFIKGKPSGALLVSDVLAMLKKKHVFPFHLSSYTSYYISVSKDLFFGGQIPPLEQLKGLVTGVAMAKPKSHMISCSMTW